MVVGVGIDLIEVARIRPVAERFGERFRTGFCGPVKRLLPGLRHPAPHLAAVLPPEAISKAFGTGIGAALGWQDMEVARHDSGQPYVILHGGGERLLASRGGGALHLSLSHTENYATAVVVWDQP
ncbi:MAG: holo-ACP synthase [Verrucomicrobiales bacterium]|nr:holo-ACP synthase [Verrucomicrobiales bacterium]